MHSSTAVTLATCLIIATIVTQSATALAFQGSQDRAKRLFWVDKKSANGVAHFADCHNRKKDSTVCVRASAADDIAECFISECIKRQLDCEMICDRQDCHSLCQTKKLGCAKACLTENSANNVLSQ